MSIVQPSYNAPFNRSFSSRLTDQNEWAVLTTLPRTFAMVGRPRITQVVPADISEIILSLTRSAWQSQTWGRPAPQVWVQNQFQKDEIPLAVMAGRMKKFSENTSTILEVMESSMLNFKANFKLSRFFLGGGTPVPLRVCASKPLSISRVCKIWGGSTP